MSETSVDLAWFDDLLDQARTRMLTDQERQRLRRALHVLRAIEQLDDDADEEDVLSVLRALEQLDGRRQDRDKEEVGR